MSLYHPISRATSSREISGCITPTNIDHHASHQLEHASPYSSVRKNSTSMSHGLHNKRSESDRKTSILSPPLSPYQRSISTREEIEELEPSFEIVSTKVFIPSKQPFKIENYKEYDLQVNPWSNLNSSYKSRQFRFLEQYSAISSKEIQTMKLEKKYQQSISNNSKRNNSSDSESDMERVRTRRIVKESSANLSEIDSSASVPPTPSSPKKRKTVRKEASYSSSPLAIQQAALIDENIPDYSPDASNTLPKGNNRCLKVEWKGQPMDLRFDPNIEKLHPAEVFLASILRLPCNVYLDSKRRLFFEKVNRLKKGQQFRRTDAQKACRIDVNKASRLFAAFEKVGWLEDDHFAKYL